MDYTSLFHTFLIKRQFCNIKIYPNYTFREYYLLKIIDYDKGDWKKFMPLFTKNSFFIILIKIVSNFNKSYIFIN